MRQHIESIDTHVLVLVVHRQRLLLGRGTKTYQKGKWIGVTGHVNGQGCQAAAVEYCRQQLGIETRLRDPVGRKDYHLPNGHKIFRVEVFLVRSYRGSVRATDQLEDLRWFPLDQLPYGEMFGDDRNFLPAVLRGYRPYHTYVSEGPNENALRSVNYLP